jgi:hypothetical protein
VYGPLLPAGTAEATTSADALAVLRQTDANVIKHDVLLASFRGVAHFDRRHPEQKEAQPARSGTFVIFAEFKCDPLTALRHELWRSVPSLEARHEAELGAIRARGDADDATYEIPSRRWAHVTLFVARASTPPEVLLRIEECARHLLEGMPEAARITRVDLMSAVSWTRIPLWSAGGF